MIGLLVADTIARFMRCTVCGVIMPAGIREVSPRTEDGRPIHQACKDKQDALPNT